MTTRYVSPAIRFMFTGSLAAYILYMGYVSSNAPNWVVPFAAILLIFNIASLAYDIYKVRRGRPS